MQTHRVSRQHGLSSRGLVTVTKPAWLHSGGGAWSWHRTGVQRTDMEPLSHTQVWQLLTHCSPGWNEPGQGPQELLGRTPALGYQLQQVTPQLPPAAAISGAAHMARMQLAPWHPIPALQGLGQGWPPIWGCSSLLLQTHKFGKPVWSNAGWKRRRKGLWGACRPGLPSPSRGLFFRPDLKLL